MTTTDDKPRLASFMPQTDAATFLGLSERTLERFRLDGTGPIFRKFGRRVLYAPGDLVAWADTHQHSSTSDDSHTAQR